MKRFILQNSEKSDHYVCTDTEHNIVCIFKAHEFNETQEVTLLDGDKFDNADEALHYATYLREMGDWLREHHYEKAFHVNTRLRIGLRIAELRKKKGMTQRDLAAATGFNPSNIGRIEVGRYSAGLDVLDKIATALDAKVDIIDNEGGH